MPIYNYYATYSQSLPLYHIVTEESFMLSIAVCDDIALECTQLARQIRRIAKTSGYDIILREFYTGQSLLQSTESFDILFLDIKMPDINGMELARLLRRREETCLLVFVTAVSEYVFEAYDVEAFAYLVKPATDEQLHKVLSRASEKLRKESTEFLLVSSQHLVRKIPLKDIVYMEAMGRILVIHTLQDVVETYGQIGLMEKRLSGKNFFRCHKGYLINLKYVDTFDKTQIYMETKEIVLLAKRRYDDFARAFMAYMRKEGGLA